jgi:hypothetical protein
MSFIIGTAGTAKNTGKTTASIAILRELFKTDISIGLTSIGYDGEDIDNITGLPKPRLLLKEGTIVATSEKCLHGSTAQLNIIKATNITTPLGKIIIARVIKEGLVVIAGPNKSIELRYVLSLLEEMNCQLIIVDGALNRIAPMIETNGIILATGAARNTDIDALVQETKILYYIFNLPEANSEEAKLVLNKKRITLFPLNNNSKTTTIDYSSLIDKQTVEKIKSNIDDTKIIFIPALLSSTILKELNDSLKNLWKDKILIINDSIKIITGGNPEGVFCQIKKTISFGGSIKVLKKVPILCITVNPFYPFYRFDKKKIRGRICRCDKAYIKNEIKPSGACCRYQKRRAYGDCFCHFKQIALSLCIYNLMGGIFWRQLPLLVQVAWGA